MQGEWIREPGADSTAVVFVHGILSNGEQCWRHDNGAYWPALLQDEPGLQVGIYVYTYQTGLGSGSYSLNDVVDDLKERLLNLDNVARCRRLVFVCHSMGGIVVRKFLVQRAYELSKHGRRV